MLRNVFASFARRAVWQRESDKSTEGHNLRKSALLSLLFFCHKLTLNGVSKFKSESAEENPFYVLICAYSRSYCEMPSLVVDLRMFFSYLGEPLRKQLISEHFAALVEERRAGTPLRLLRAELSRAKFVKSLGGGAETLEGFLASEEFASLLRGYWAANALESKPP